MFTGIVETVGRVRSLEPRGELCVLALEAPEIAAGMALGQSVAVNGSCLTVAGLEDGGLRFDVVRETLARTNLGELRAGAHVNLERALRADGRLDGHLVQGHVDGLGRVRELARRGDDVRLAVDCEPALADTLVEKGSVAVDGVSLTVAAVREAGFDVALVPHTLARTTLCERRPGDRVNLEGDVLGKYVQRSLARLGLAGGGAGRA